MKVFNSENQRPQCYHYTNMGIMFNPIIKKTNELNDNNQSRNQMSDYIEQENATNLGEDDDKMSKVSCHIIIPRKRNNNSQRLFLLDTEDSSNEIQRIIQQKNTKTIEQNELKLSPSIDVIRPIEKKEWLKCRIEKNVIKNKDTFTLYTSEENSFLLQATKVKKGYYSISGTKNDNDSLGVINANFMTTQFSLYTKYDEKNKNKSINLGGVIYDMNLFGGGNNKMTVLIPRIKDKQEMLGFNMNNTLITAYNKDFTHAFDSMKCFDNIKPELKEDVGYVLNFGHRKIVKSVKNFQLEEKGESDLLLQFGKTSTNNFILDYTYPFSPIQAFFIAISSIEK